MSRTGLLGVLLAIAAAACATPTTSGVDGDADADGDVAGDGAPDSDHGSDGGERTCADDGDCDDGVPCTEDLCSVGGVCRNEPIDARCPAEQRCVPGHGCRDEQCLGPADCDDGVFCNGVERCVYGACFPAEAPRDCDDGDECTRDYCSVATDRCVHERLPGCVTDGGVDGGPDPFDAELHYGGAFRVVGIPRSDCLAATYNIARVTISSTPEQLTIQAGAFPLTQTPRPAGPDFATAYTHAGCGIYTLTGSFANADQFSARWTATFSDGCNMCGDQDAPGVFGGRE